MWLILSVFTWGLFLFLYFKSFKKDIYQNLSKWKHLRRWTWNTSKVIGLLEQKHSFSCKYSKRKNESQYLRFSVMRDVPSTYEAASKWGNGEQTLPRALLESQLLKWDGLGDGTDSRTRTPTTHRWLFNRHPPQREDCFLPPDWCMKQVSQSVHDNRD